MSKKNDALGTRMKEYEYKTRKYLERKQPVICRIDGKAFHSFTRGLKKPFDEIFVKSMQDTMKYLCDNIQGCVLGYCQSDEITLVLVDYQSEEACAWFDNNIQKITSVSASMATFAFNKAFKVNSETTLRRINNTFACTDEEFKYANTIEKCLSNGAMFDSRVFTLPKEEVVNCLIWRQQDAIRNSIQSVGQANFSHTELHGKNCSEINDMLWLKKDIDWNSYPIHLKRGSCCIKKPFVINEGTEQETTRNKWVLDTEIPIFTHNKDYVNNLVFV